MIVDVLADPDKGDHVAVYETDTATTERYSVRVELTGGDFTLDLTPWPSQTVYIAIYSEYSTLGTTSASVRVYTEAEYAGAVEKDELIILGTVNVPALGNPVPAVDVTGSYRTLPFDNIASDAKLWVPLLPNAGFEAECVVGNLGVNGIPWHRYVPAAGGADYVWGVTDSDSYEGSRCAELTVQVASPTALSLSSQNVAIPVKEGQRIKWRFVYKPLQTAAVDNLSLRLYHMTDIWGVQSYTVLATLDSTVTGSWIVLEGMIEVPVGVSFLTRFYVGNTGIGTTNYPAIGDALRIDSMQLWAEPVVDPDVLGSDLYSSQLFLQLFPGAPAAVDPVLQASAEGLKIVRSDEDDTAADQPSVSTPGQLVLRRAKENMDWEIPSVSQDIAGHAAPEIPLLSYTATSYASIREYALGLTASAVRRYWTINAAYDTGTTNWVYDDSTAASIQMQLSQSAFYLYGQAAPQVGGVIPWESAIILGFTSLGGAPRVAYVDLDLEPITGGVPDIGVDDFYLPDQRLYSRNICKAWGKLRTVLDGGGPGVTTIEVLTGYNIDSIPAPSFPGDGSVKVWLDSDMLSGVHTTAVGNTFNTATYCSIKPDASGDFILIYSVNPTTGAVVDLETVDEDIDFILFGVTPT
jgi:hypothetical protein